MVWFLRLTTTQEPGVQGLPINDSHRNLCIHHAAVRQCIRSTSLVIRHSNSDIACNIEREPRKDVSILHVYVPGMVLHQAPTMYFPNGTYPLGSGLMVDNFDEVQSSYYTLDMYMHA